MGCVLDERMSGGTVALRVAEKINPRLKFLCQKNQFLDVFLRRRLCNALLQPHFDYACTVWYPYWTKQLKDKLKVIQNECIRFYLKLQCRKYISNEHFQKLNWLTINQTFKQCLTSTVLNFLKTNSQSVWVKF